MTTNHLILDFSHVYCDENIPKNIGIHWLDCSEIEECDLYCSRQAEEKIREKIKPYGIHGIHFLDSGNYHYVTEIMTSQIQKEFQLVVFDHHTDKLRRLGRKGVRDESMVAATGINRTAGEGYRAALSGK